MITLCRADQRQHDHRRKHEVWLTCEPGAPTELLAGGFGALEILVEGRLAPGAEAPRRAHQDAELVTYVREGALAYADSVGRSGVIQAGEFHCVPVGHAIRHTQTNASRTDWTHVFQMWLRFAESGRPPRQDQKRFSTADRRAGLCMVASSDAREGSLRVQQDVRIFSAVLDAGQHVVHELAPGRRAWLHLVEGEATLGDVVLTTGDGAGATAERTVSLTARVETEILLLDLGKDPQPITNP